MLSIKNETFIVLKEYNKSLVQLLIHILPGLTDCYTADSKRDDEQYLIGMPM